ncbi:MAG: helix-turn-helix domain-containing protein [Vampirovibrio sp.]|jgi:hypothetical protein|nr:helix-turn-helix domain-containing protein [Vampirovibrio sp.]
MMTSQQQPQAQKTLALLVQEARVAKNLTTLQLAEKARLPLSFVEQLEEGQVIFLSQYQRGLLARALSLEPMEIKRLELWSHESFSTWEVPTLSSHHPQTGHLLFTNGKSLPLKEMQRHPEGFWPCPHCGASVRCLTSLLEDHEGFLVLKSRLTCTACLFQCSVEEPQ